MNETIKKLMDNLVHECQKQGASCVVGVVSDNEPVEIITGGNAFDVVTILQVGVNTIVEATGLPFGSISNIVSKTIDKEGVMAYDM